jgi:hypothetical protein
MKRREIFDGLLWHYTVGPSFLSIIEDGLIRPTEVLLCPGERPIVWFSANQIWERTAGLALGDEEGAFVRSLSIEEMTQYGGIVRFGVAPETAPYDWNALKELSRMPAWVARGLYDIAIKKGARPGEWYGTFDAVPRLKWQAIHVYEKGCWVPVGVDAQGRLTDDVIAQRFASVPQAKWKDGAPNRGHDLPLLAKGPKGTVGDGL